MSNEQNTNETTQTQTIFSKVLRDLDGRTSRKVANNTYLQKRDESTIALLYHATDVVTYHQDGRVVLNTGGWKTSTTKLRFNEGYARLPIRGVYANRGTWFVTTNEPTGEVSKYGYPEHVEYPFADGLTLQLNGDGLYHVDTDTIGDDLKKTQKLRKRVQAYAVGFIAALRAGNVPAPSNGDCMLCLMRDTATKVPWGESTKDHGHILSHIEEKYYVPSLLVRACEVMPCSQVMRWCMASKWGLLKDEHGNVSTFVGHDYDWQALTKMLARYVLRQLGEVS